MKVNSGWGGVELDLYKARVDTTFALYRPYCFGSASFFQVTFRLGGKYSMRHQPWYANTLNPTDEEKFYQSLFEKGGAGIATGWYAKTES